MQEFFFKPVDENGTFCAVRYNGDDAEVVIPEKYCGLPVTILFDDLFKGHKEITSVQIPDSVREIGGFVFDGCESLTLIELPDSVENLWQYAFVRSGFEEVRLPEKLKYIPPFAFKDCKKLKRVICNDALAEICAFAFQGCDNLVEIVHGENVNISPLARK